MDVEQGIEARVLANEERLLQAQIRAVPWVVSSESDICFNRNRSTTSNPRNCGAIVQACLWKGADGCEGQQYMRITDFIDGEAAGEVA